MCRMFLLVLRPIVGRMKWSQREGSGVGEPDAADSAGEPSQASMGTCSRRRYCAGVLKRVRPDRWSGFLLSESVFERE